MRKLEHDEIERPSLGELALMGRFPITVVLENVRSAHNVGSILRTADAIRAERIVMAGVTPPGTHRGVHKSALGSQESVPWSMHASPADAVESEKAAGKTIVALELTDSPMAISDLTPSVFPVCLLVGNELSGLSGELLALSDVAVELPQFGFKQSLNVSVAAGIAMYGLLDLYRSAYPGHEHALNKTSSHSS